MELVLISLGILAVLVLVAGVMDFRNRKRRRPLSIDQDEVRSHRHSTLGRYDLYDGPH